MMTLTIHYYIVPQLLLAKVCHRAFNNTVCTDHGSHKFKEQEDYVINKAAEWNVLINFSGYCPAIILTLPAGHISSTQNSSTNLVSKNKMLLLPVIASLVSCLILLCSSISIRLHVGYLVLAIFIVSVFGEVMGCITLCCEYAKSAWSDNSTMAVSMVLASVGIGQGIGGVTANYLKRYYGFSCVFIFTLILLAVNMMYASVLLPPIDDVKEKCSEESRNGFWNDFIELTKDTWFHLLSFSKKYICHSEDKTIFLLLVAAFLSPW